MSGLLLHSASDDGMKRYWRSNGDGTHDVVTVQDLTPVVDRCQAMSNHNDGYSKSRELRRIAFIPAVLMVKWLNEEGWWWFDPDAGPQRDRKLRDPDYAYLRTSPGAV